MSDRPERVSASCVRKPPFLARLAFRMAWFPVSAILGIFATLVRGARRPPPGIGGVIRYVSRSWSPVSAVVAAIAGAAAAHFWTIVTMPNAGWGDILFAPRQALLPETPRR